MSLSSSLDTLPIIEAIAQFSAASPQAALRQPIAEIVQNTINASAKGNDNTSRAYQTAMGLFMIFLDYKRGDLIPPDMAAQWRPFAESKKDGRRTVWVFRPPAVVLRLVDASLLDGFGVWRAAEGDSPNTISLRQYAVRTFLNIAYRDNILTYEQAMSMRLQPYRTRQTRDVRPVGRRLTTGEVRLLREAVDTRTLKGKRDLAVLDCMLYLGLRRDEVVHLRAGNLKRDGERWWVALTGKGGKTRRLRIHEVVYQSITEWMREIGIDTTQPDRQLFQSVNKGDNLGRMPINASVVGRLVAEYGAKAGLAPRHGENQLSAHDLRRTCARIAYDNSKNLLLVQAMLGHSDPKTTARYIGAFDDDHETAIDFVRY